MNEEGSSSKLSQTGDEKFPESDQSRPPPSPPLTLTLADDLSQLGIPDDQINNLNEGELSEGSYVHRRGGRKKAQVAQEDDGEISSDSREYQRGGRKPDQFEESDDKELVSDLHMYDRDDKKPKKRRIPPPSEGSLPWSQRSGRLAPMDPDAFPSVENQIPNHGSQVTAEQSPASQCPYCSKPQTEKLSSPTRETETIEPQPEPRHDPKRSPSGLGSLFNIRRGDKSGPPIGVYVDRDEKERKRKAAKKKKERKAKRVVETSEDSGSSEEETEPKRKPVQIRLDLNLEMEVLFKAKIKGDVTITFLE